MVRVSEEEISNSAVVIIALYQYCKVHSFSLSGINHRDLCMHMFTAGSLVHASYSPEQYCLVAAKQCTLLDVPAAYHALSGCTC
jgi:hypothetical protein